MQKWKFLLILDLDTISTTATSKPKAMQNLVKRRRKMPTLKTTTPTKNNKKGKKKGTKSPRTTRLSDENMRTTRAKEHTQKWENLIATNPEQILKRK